MADLPTDPEFDSFIRRASSFSIQTFLESRGLWKRTMNGDRGVKCPACGGDDRFAVNVRKNVFTCRKSGAGGGVIALWAHLRGMERPRGRDFIEACSEILNEDPPNARSDETAAEKMARIDRRRQLAELQAASSAKEDARRANEARKYRERERHRAWILWREAAPAVASPVEDMLAIRGLSVPADADLRFHADAPLWAPGTAVTNFRPRLVHRGPAMLGAICGPEFVETATGWRRRFLGVKVTWIDLADRDGKLRMADPETGQVLPAKKVIGSWKGGSIRLGGAPETGSGPEVMVAGEGIETVLSARAFLMADPDWQGGEITEFRSFDCLDNFAGKADATIPHPTIKRPDARGAMRADRVRGPEPAWPDPIEPVPVRPCTRELIWLRDGDSEPFFTEMAMRRGAARYARHYPHLTIRIAEADGGADFNDMWRGMAA